MDRSETLLRDILNALNTVIERLDTLVEIADQIEKQMPQPAEDDAQK